MSQPYALSRREVLRTATALGVGGALIGTASAADPLPLFAASGLVTGKPKPLKYDELPGLLTKAQVAPHYAAHYGGALKRYVAIEEQLDKLHAGNAPLGGDAFVFLQRDKLNRMNSVLLHELYFDGLAAKPDAIGADIRGEIAKRFGSFERWVEDFQLCCGAAAGWGMLARDAVNGKLYNVVSDQHENGVIWLGQPLVVCDVYEHAFYVDYTNKKADYVKKFVAFIDWAEVTRRYVALAR